MAWACEVPRELTEKAQGLVVLTGLDLTYNAVHKTIWDAFSNNRRPDRVPLLFKCLDADYEYPKAKPKVKWFILLEKFYFTLFFLFSHINIIEIELRMVSPQRHS